MFVATYATELLENIQIVAPFHNAQIRTLYIVRNVFAIEKAIAEKH